jgi:hypothetical protein
VRSTKVMQEWPDSPLLSKPATNDQIVATWVDLLQTSKTQSRAPRKSVAALTAVRLDYIKRGKPSQ